MNGKPFLELTADQQNSLLTPLAFKEKVRPGKRMAGNSACL